jgi:hypothetical protein
MNTALVRARYRCYLGVATLLWVWVWVGVSVGVSVGVDVSMPCFSHVYRVLCNAMLCCELVYLSVIVSL